MRTIFRYKIAITDKSVLLMPSGAKVLPSPPGDRNNGSEIEIWAQVDDTQPTERREFRVVGTGNPMPDDCDTFIGTVITHGGQFVWHLFEANK